MTVCLKREGGVGMFLGVVGKGGWGRGGGGRRKTGKEKEEEKEKEKEKEKKKEKNREGVEMVSLLIIINYLLLWFLRFR